MRPLGRAILGAMLATALFLPAPSRAGRVPWNQEKVTAIAADLSRALERLRVALEGDPEQASVVQERKRQGVLVDVRTLARLSEDLAARLKAGQGLDETRPVYGEIQQVRRQARDAGRNLFTPDATQADIVAARGLLQRLEGFYEER